jgi:predicted TPR repeat methyltransferase
MGTRIWVGFQRSPGRRWRFEMEHRLELGEEYFRNQQVDMAEKVFLSILEAKPDVKEALNNLGVIAFQKGEPTRAIRYFTEALKIDGSYEDALANLREAFLSQERRDSREMQEPGARLPRNINTREYWDKAYSAEIGKHEWRRYVVSFNKVRTYIGVRAERHETILDIGCGYGLLLDALRPLGLAMEGWDISGVAVERIRAKGYRGKQLDFSKAHAGEGMWDYVIATEFLEHLDEPEAILLQMYQIARKSVAVTVPDKCLSPKECAEHRQVFSRTDFLEMTEGWSIGKRYVEEFEEEFVYQDARRAPTLIRKPTLLVILEK